jgi:hypothetical protein
MMSHIDHKNSIEDSNNIIETLKEANTIEEEKAKEVRQNYGIGKEEKPKEENQFTEICKES